MTLTSYLLWAGERIPPYNVLSPKGVRVHRSIYGMEIQDLKDKVMILSFILRVNNYKRHPFNFQLLAFSYELPATSYELSRLLFVFYHSPKIVLDIERMFVYY